MKTKNYYVRWFENAVKQGENVEKLAQQLEDTAEQARLQGAWPVWVQINEAMMILGI